MNQYFEKVYCLNQRERPDRWKQACEEFTRVGLQVEQFYSIPAEHPHKSFCLSQYAMLKQFLGTKAKTLLALEDDVIFKKRDHLQQALAELPADWDLLYLGANLTPMVWGIEENPPVRYSEHLHRVKRAWMSHGIAYSRKMVDTIVASYPVQDFRMYDEWLSTVMLQAHNCFIMNPQIAWQRSGKSDLWGNETDYTGAFEWGDKFLSNDRK